MWVAGTEEGWLVGGCDDVSGGAALNYLGGGEH